MVLRARVIRVMIIEEAKFKIFSKTYSCQSSSIGFGKSSRRIQLFMVNFTMFQIRNYVQRSPKTETPAGFQNIFAVVVMDRF